MFRNSDNGHIDVSGTQSIDDDKGAEEAAGIDSNVKTAIKDLLVTFEECEEDAEIEREMISNISSYAAALGTAQCEDDAEPAVEDTAAASNEVAEGERKDHSETGSSDADSSSESEGEFTIKTNSPLSSAMTLVLNRRGSCRRSGGPRSGEGKGKGEGKGEGREGQDGGWGGWAGRERRARGERCCAEAADNSHTRGQACRMA